MKHEIRIPAGCNVKFSIENGMAITEIEGCETIKLNGNVENEPKFEENDIIIIDESDICILKNKLSDCNFYNTKVYYDIKFDKLFNRNSTLSGNVRLATEDEKEILFDAMKKENLTFDGENILELSEKFKENDILTCEMDGNKWVAIFKDEIDNFSFNAKVVYVCDTNDINKNDWASYGRTCRIATEEEKQLLFDKLREKCLMFDGENVVRWRAKMDGAYFFLIDTNRIDWEIDRIGSASSVRYNIGNYFPTKEMAEAFQKQYIELLNNFHKNL